MTDHPNRSADIARACAKFVMWCMNEGSFEGCDINGGEAQDKAVELGLLDTTTYDPNRHGPSDCCEQGDNWYVPMPELISLLSGAPAQAEQVRAATIEECARVAENYPSSGSATEHPVEYWIRALASQPSPAATVETKSAPELGPSQNNAERLPSSNAAGSGAGTQCSAATEDEMGVIESDRLFAEQILADFGSFEEGIADQEKLAQWIRNVRRACSTPVEPQEVSMATPADVAEVLGHLATRKAADEIRKIINSAMAWQPSENGPSYDQRSRELFTKMNAALALSRIRER